MAHDLRIQACSSRQKILEAVNTLSNQQLHIYQVLYFKGLTSPGGRPLEVKRHVPNPVIVSPLIEISYPPQTSLKFFCWGSESDEEILTKARMCIEGYGKPKVDFRACCCYAKFRGCVCTVSFDCPLHGKTCFGTHD